MSSSQPPCVGCKCLPARFVAKSYIITGGNSGIGEAIATRLAEEGAFGVTLVARNEEAGARVCEKLGDLGCKAIFVKAELACVDEVVKIVPAHIDEFGSLDGLVNCAADTGRHYLRDTPVEYLDNILAVNVRAPFLLIQAASNWMREHKKRGAIVNILTIEAHGGPPRLCCYAASKGALSTLTKNAAYELASDGINVNGINMGWSPTPHEHLNQTGRGASEDWAEKAAEASPFKKLVEPSEVAALAAFMMSDEAGVMTGSLVDFDQTVPGAHPDGEFK